jgi:hypothetical protein
MKDSAHRSQVSFFDGAIDAAIDAPSKSSLSSVSMSAQVLEGVTTAQDAEEDAGGAAAAAEEEAAEEEAAMTSHTQPKC